MVLAVATSLDAKVITKDYNYANFTGLEVNSCFKVELTQSDNYQVVIEIDDEYFEYLRVGEERGRLVIKIDSERLPKKLRNIKDDVVMRASVSMPVLHSLRLSGAVKLRTSSTFESHQVNQFNLSLSGASGVDRLDISGNAARIDISGASKLNISAKFFDVDMECSGASSMKADLDCGDAEINLSGASRGDIFGNFTELDIDCSGASKAIVEGSAKEAQYEAAGASSIKAENMVCEKVNVELSGASGCRVNATRYLDVECSGASSCKYVDNGDIIIKYNGNRSSSLNRIK